MLHQLSQQWVTFSNLEWLFHAQHAISVEAELLVTVLTAWEQIFHMRS